MKKEHDNKKENKKLKKVIVNGLTVSRFVATILMPFLYSALSAPMFIIAIAALLFTDFLDGMLARKWDVSTIFGSLADMSADKALGCAVLVVLSSMYPSMKILLGMELGIIATNLFSASNGALGQSSQIGRIKTWVLSVSMCVLLLTGMSPELVESISNIKISDLNDSFLSKINLDEVVSKVVNGMKDGINFVEDNKELVETVAKTSAFTSEGLVAADYAIKSIKQVGKNSRSFKLSKYITSKEFRDYVNKHIKKVIFDEKYCKETKDMPMVERLIPEECREEVKKKVLKPDNSKK